MKKITQLALICISIYLAGCQPVIKLIYGVKNPRYETATSIMEWTKKMGLPEAPVYSCAFESWQANDQFHSPDVFVFDKNGKFIPYKDSLKPNCSGPAELFLAYLDPTHEYHLSDQYSIDTFYQLLNTTSCEKINYLKKEAVDFHIFITFTKWQGMYLQKNKTLVWLDSLSKNENIKYELVFVNTDLQDCWSESQKQFFITR